MTPSRIESARTEPAARLPADFLSLALISPLAKAIADEGYATPTPIQAQAIPPLLEGRDLLGCAQTGTGKTAAFVLPILQRLAAAGPVATGPKLPRVLILAPTRELASQIGESIHAYGRHLRFTHTIIFGGVSQHRQVQALKTGVDILVATPGRLIDLLDQKIVRLDRINCLVLDEADRMLDMGFIQPIRRIVAALPKSTALPRQTMLFSATMPSEIRTLAESLLRDPVRVAVTPVASAAPKIEQSVYHVARNQKQALLHHLLADDGMSRAVVFTRTKHGADKVARKLQQCGVSADAIHGNKAQNRRERTLAGFRNGSIRVLVATDVAARGLDIDGVSHVVNFDLPNEPEAYVHRIGRTGRAGATGIAIAFCDAEERPLLKEIERLTKVPVPVRSTPTVAQLPASDPSASDRAPRSERRSAPHRAAPRSAVPARAEGERRPDRAHGRTGSRTAEARSTVESRSGQRPTAAPPVPARPIGIAMRGRGSPRR